MKRCYYFCMKIRPQASSVLNITYWVLLGLFLCLAAFILGGTIYSFFSRSESATPFVFSDTADSRIFTGIGRLRLPASPAIDSPTGADADPATVIISITFPYIPEDLAFSEELATRVNDFRTIAREYFSAHSAEELRLMDEEIIKNEMLQRFNSVLRLGKIEILYFNDFLVIE